MERYYVNRLAQANGDNEVHKEGCRWLPEPWHRIDLGYQWSDLDALREAQKYYPYTADGCCHCCPSIHRH